MDNSITMPNSGAPLVGASDFILVTMKGMDISAANTKEKRKRKEKNQTTDKLKSATQRKNKHQQIKTGNAKKMTLQRKKNIANKNEWVTLL